ncbi:MAG: AAA-like domain-containing protein, partial [Oscillatoria sp. PMC 1068.18]|nr:AAA-like domain-containing protein [Oscillatoria sp. PMC 1068.18]
MELSSNSAYSYQVGGSLPVNSPTYTIRKADAELYQGIKAGDFCYVLNSRQMGKSSLRVRTMQRLQSQGIACVAIDLTAIGSQNITSDQWYAGISYTLASSFQTLEKIDLGNWWCQREFLSPVQRLDTFLQEILLQEIQEELVIFVDEIDSILSLNFPVDDFFALIRACYNKRAYKPEYQRLTWVLLGVATPSELITDKDATPFNIGVPIRLTGFRLGECAGLARGLVKKADNPLAVLKIILAWTGGKPFLTQKICHLVQNNHDFIPSGEEIKIIEKIVRSQIIENWETQDEPEHLRSIRSRLLEKGNHSLKLLTLYQKILQQGEIPADNST